MKKSNVLAIISVAFFGAILFTPVGNKYWLLFLALGTIFGIIWYMSRD
jgi:hypothetical protein